MRIMRRHFGALVRGQNSRLTLGQALASAREEALLMIGMWFAAFGVSQIPNLDGGLPGLLGSPDLSVWVAVLLIQSVPHAATVIVSIINAFALSDHWIGECRAEPASATRWTWSAPLRRLLRMGDERG